MTTNPGALHLFQQNEAVLRRQLARKLPADEIPDALHDVYERFLRGDLSAVRNPGGLLFTIAERVIADRLAGRDSRCIRLEREQLDAMPGEGLAPDELVEKLERDLRLHRAIDKLSATYRAVVVLKGRDLTYAEIGSELGISVDTVDTYWRRAKDKLRRLLNGR